MVGTVVNAAVVTVIGFLLAWLGKGRFDALERRMDTVQCSIDALRSDLTQVALAVGAGRRAENA
ncbi:MAG: hypothetical protein ACRDKA_05520 [Actinomycetota bacterium]